MIIACQNCLNLKLEQEFYELEEDCGYLFCEHCYLPGGPDLLYEWLFTW